MDLLTWLIVGLVAGVLASLLMGGTGYGLLGDIDTLHLDRGYDYPIVRERLTALGLDDVITQRRGTKPTPGTPHRLTLGLRWIVEAPNSWWSDYGQLRRSTDCQPHPPPG